MMATVGLSWVKVVPGAGSKAACCSGYQALRQRLSGMIVRETILSLTSLMSRAGRNALWQILCMPLVPMGVGESAQTLAGLTIVGLAMVTPGLSIRERRSQLRRTLVSGAWTSGQERNPFYSR